MTSALMVEELEIQPPMAVPPDRMVSSHGFARISYLSLDTVW